MPIRKHSISFQNASKGIIHAASTQLNLRIHLVITIIVILISVWFQISPFEAVILILTISLVLTAELINTSIEYLGDAITMQTNLNIKNAKDVSAGAVLVAAILASVVGLIIFLPKLFLMLNT